MTEKQKKFTDEIESESQVGGSQRAIPKTSILLQRAIDGDRASLEHVVMHLSPLVEAQVRFRLGSLSQNTADVEDLVAEVWVVVMRKLPTLRPRNGHFAPVLGKYLATASTHLCNNFIRRLVRRKSMPLISSDTSEQGIRVDELARETRSVLTRVFQTEVTELIRKSLARLSAEKREILVLRLMEHRTNQEIAELMEILPNTVAVKYARALEELRKRLPKSVFQELWGFRETPNDEPG